MLIIMYLFAASAFGLIRTPGAALSLRCLASSPRIGSPFLFMTLASPAVHHSSAHFPGLEHSNMGYPACAALTAIAATSTGSLDNSVWRCMSPHWLHPAELASFASHKHCLRGGPACAFINATILQSPTAESLLTACIHICCPSGRKALWHCSTPGQIHIAQHCASGHLSGCCSSNPCAAMATLLMVSKMCQTVAPVWPFSRMGWTFMQGSFPEFAVAPALC